MPESEAEPTSAPPRSVWKRIFDPIDAHPIPTLILVTAVITLVFWNKVDSAVNSLYNATTRVDSVVRDLGIALGRIEAAANDIRKVSEEIREIRLNDIKELRLDVKPIREFEIIIKRTEATINSINTQFQSIKPFEIRVIESFGIDVNDTLFVDVVAGMPTAFPLDEDRSQELQRKNFIKTSYQITRPKHAFGWIPPQPISYVAARPSGPLPGVGAVSTPRPVRQQ
ncbi:MAG TPA: hypothetical protein VF744_16540 [Beijerinckiaceae bacterium]|jgi:hypothetical protein